MAKDRMQTLSIPYRGNCTCFVTLTVEVTGYEDVALLQSTMKESRQIQLELKDLFCVVDVGLFHCKVTQKFREKSNL